MTTKAIRVIIFLLECVNTRCVGVKTFELQAIQV